MSNPFIDYVTFARRFDECKIYFATKNKINT